MKFQLSALISSLILANSVSAATIVDLQHQPFNYLKQFQSLSANPEQLKQVRTDVDFNQVAHVRLQQMYSGLPVWDAAAVVHIPKSNLSGNNLMTAKSTNNTTMNGIVYEGLDKDLASLPAYALNSAQQSRAMQQAKLAYEKNTSLAAIKYQQESIQSIIFVDDKNQAHYAYLISFYVDDGQTGAHRPTMIMDAASLHVYRQWDQVMTIKLKDGDKPQPVIAGGIGGNEKSGEIIYDGQTGHAPGLPMQSFTFSYERIPGQKLVLTFCILQNEDVVVQDVGYGSEPAAGLCFLMPGSHNNMTWLSNDAGGTRWKSDEVNGGFSPSMDALYAATVVKKFYQDWYNIPVLIQDDGKTPLKLIMRVHYGRNFDNAFWDGKQMTFGDGGKMFYPLTSLGVTAHEISHGFTQQHSNIDGSQPQMGALHEAFSDMSSVSAQYYLQGNNTWDIGREIMKPEGALRYLDTPQKDGRSIDHMKDYDDSEPHLAAGVFNKAFYLIATSSGWNTRKAFNVMVKANMHYWNASMKTFADAACGVLSATKDYNYNISDVRIAFAKVGIDTDKCEVH